MRLDDYLSTVGIVKRRTVAKELARNNMISVNGRSVKPAYEVKAHDFVRIKGTNPATYEILDIPRGSVSKELRQKFFKQLPANEN